MSTDCLFIIAVSVLSAFIAEGLSWLLIYRTDTYKVLKENIERLNKKLEKTKEKSASLSAKRAKDKKVAFYDEQLKLLSRDLTISKMKATFFVMFTVLAVLGMLNSMFDGRAVAKLPFLPIPLIRGMTHRNLPGTDFTDCSLTFMYVLSSMAARPNVQKLLGFTPPKTSSSIWTPPEQPPY